MEGDQRGFRGYAYITAAAFCFGVAAALGRAAFTGRLFPDGHALPSIGPLILTQTRTTFSFLALLPALALLRGWKRLQVSRGDFLRLLLLGVLGVAGSNYFYYLAIEKTTVATAITLQYTAPVWVLAYLVLRRVQKLTLARLSAVVLALAGIVLVTGWFGIHALHPDRLGVLAGLLAAFSFAFYNIAGHDILSRYDSWKVLLYVTLTASLFWAAVNPPARVAATHYTVAQWLFLIGFALISLLLPYSLYLAGLSYLDPARAIVVSCLEPAFSIVLAALFLGETLRPAQGLGIVLVLGAVVAARA